ncbi:MAG: polysaccharide deacetylase family protein [Deltaproteobacteria bacterium]|nr:polysaccharide deacetylase family protein [Deltaproteobacteria bacterium]MBW1814057.1 polysaccharide deacetylase family protein [Deltaproteobacteria bacterium]MBW1846950.1 polysaccharide deacetylase family protein [Deltaproteobacteria bacterium]MBW1984890.1 polysaccharide deacetylase family protein [Deltaproteobacteria bacterium]
MQKKIACISLDIESDLGDPERRVRLFDDSRLMEHFGGIIHQHGVQVTGFLVTSLIKSYGNTLKNLNQHFPIEFSVHSHDHDTDNACSRDQIHQAVDTFRAFWGFSPTGYRAPNGLINPEGIHHLMDFDFEYDSSIFPSIRFDEYGYSNLHFPMEPFLFERGSQSLMEMPLACLKRIRLVFSLSHVKLLGWAFYRILMMFFPLPKVVILNVHPYDFYIPLISKYIKGWKKIAHLRNSNNAFDIFNHILKMLKNKGYEFMFMSELNRYLREVQTLKKLPLVEK